MRAETPSKGPPLCSRFLSVGSDMMDGRRLLTYIRYIHLFWMGFFLRFVLFFFSLLSLQATNPELPAAELCDLRVPLALHVACGVGHSSEEPRVVCSPQDGLLVLRTLQVSLRGSAGS